MTFLSFVIERHETLVYDVFPALKHLGEIYSRRTVVLQRVYLSTRQFKCTRLNAELKGIRWITGRLYGIMLPLHSTFTVLKATVCRVWIYWQYETIWVPLEWFKWCYHKKKLHTQWPCMTDCTYIWIFYYLRETEQWCTTWHFGSRLEFKWHCPMR